MISDLIVATPTLLGTQNPKLLGPENEVFGIILRWDPFHRLGLARIEEENQWSGIGRRMGKLTHSSPILPAAERQNEVGESNWY